MEALLIFLVLLYGWGYSLWRQTAERERVESLSQMREVNALDQRESRPYLTNDGGRGPGGGRILLAAPVTEGLIWHAVLCAVICLACAFSIWSITTANAAMSYWQLLAGAGIAFCGFFYYVLRLSALRQFIVEIEQYPAATGETITVRLYAVRSIGEHATYNVRLILRESLRHVERKGDPWQHRIVWSSPMESRWVRIDPTGLIAEFQWQLPEDETGTFRDPNYRVTWGIQVGCKYGDSLPLFAELYAFPVVQ